MEWFRAWHGLPNDPKLALVAAKCKARRGEALEVWLVLLDFASQNQPRGNISGFDTEQAAWVLELPTEKVSCLISAMRDRGMIDPDGNLTAWTRRNPKREDDSTERVKRYRENVTQRNAAKRDETQCNSREIERERERENTSAAAVKTTGLGLVGQTQQQQQPPPVPWPESTEYPLTLSACRRHDPGVDLIFVQQIVQKTIQHAISHGVRNGELAHITDRTIAKAIDESYSTGPPKHRSGLLLNRVPAIILSWCQEEN